MWYTVSEYTLFLAHDINKTGISYHLSEKLCRCVWCSNQYVHRQEGMSNAKHFCQLFGYFVDFCNDHRSELFLLKIFYVHMSPYQSGMDCGGYGLILAYQNLWPWIKILSMDLKLKIFVVIIP